MEFDPDELPVPDLALHCRHCGYPLRGLGAHRCPECGRAFTLDEFIPPGDFPTLIVEGRELRITPEIEALLRREAILYMDARSPLESIRPMFGPEQPRGRLAVARSEYLRAVWLIVRWLRDGIAPAPRTAAADWRCAGCGEENPGTFELCWQCGEERGGG